MDIITSRNNSKIKTVRALHQRKQRQLSDLFIVEGIHHVGEAISASEAPHSRILIDSIYYAPQLLKSEFALDLLEWQTLRGVSCYPTTTEVFTSIASKDNPQGILSVVRCPRWTLDELSPASFPWGVALLSPQDPGNLGSILRTIDAVGASGMILLDGGVDPFHPTAVRASMGALFWYPIVSTSSGDFVAWTQDRGYIVYGTSAHGDASMNSVGNYKRPCILLMGSEREGLTGELSSICHSTLQLPMQGRVTSLNLAVAAAVFLYDMLHDCLD